MTKTASPHAPTEKKQHHSGMGAAASGERQTRGPSVLDGAGHAPLDEDALALLEAQQHLFADWPALRARLGSGAPITGSDRKQLDQLAALDARLDLATYIKTSQRLLEAAKNKVNPLDGWAPTIPQGETLEAHSEAWRARERVGLEEAGRCAFVLVAGGLGERLGYEGIKVSLPTESTTGTCYLELYIRTILEFQRRSSSQPLPLCLMLSADTETATKKLLKDNDNFGMAPDQIEFVIQAGVPAFMDCQGRFVLQDGDVLCKPHGHGDVHALLAQSGLPQEWLRNGLKRVFFFQDTNAFALRTLVPALGSCVAQELVVCSTCVQRRAGEAMGALCVLTKHKERRLANVEYNQLEPLLLATTGTGDVGVTSPYPGNTNQLVIALDGPDGYVATLHRTHGRVPEFVNPKFHADRTLKKPARLECMMQDYPLLLRSGAAVGFCVLKRRAVREYAPVKNHCEAAAEKIKQGLDAHCAATGEADFYRLHGDFLTCGANVEIGAKDPSVTYRGVSVEMPPRVVLSPSFALIEDDVAKRCASVTVGRGATLVIEGEGHVELEDIVVAPGAALRITTVRGVVLRVLGLRVANAGYRVEATDAGAPAERIRGFRVVRRDEVHLAFREAGTYAVAPLSLADEFEDGALFLPPLALGAAALVVLAFCLPWVARAPAGDVAFDCGYFERVCAWYTG